MYAMLIILKPYLVCVEHSVIDKAVTGFLGCASFNFEVEDATFLASSFVRIFILTTQHLPLAVISEYSLSFITFLQC